MLPYWSYVLALVGAVGFLFVIRGSVLGPWIGFLNQFLWAAYATLPNNGGFWFSVALYGPINAYAIYTFHKRKEDNAE